MIKIDIKDLIDITDIKNIRLNAKNCVTYVIPFVKTKVLLRNLFQ